MFVIIKTNPFLPFSFVLDSDGMPLFVREVSLSNIFEMKTEARFVPPYRKVYRVLMNVGRR